MDISEAALRAAVARHAPVLRLHPADAFMPCTAEFFLQHSALVVAGSAAEVVVPRGRVTPEALLRAEAERPGVLLALDLDPAARGGFPQVRQRRRGGGGGLTVLFLVWTPTRRCSGVECPRQADAPRAPFLCNRPSWRRSPSTRTPRRCCRPAIPQTAAVLQRRSRSPT